MPRKYRIRQDTFVRNCRNGQKKKKEVDYVNGNRWGDN